MTPQQNQIIDMLSDSRKHCPTFELYQKDDRKRISELRQMGYVFNEGAGYCEDPTHHHRAKVKLRQLISYPPTGETYEFNKADKILELTGFQTILGSNTPFPLNKQEAEIMVAPDWIKIDSELGYFWAYWKCGKTMEGKYTTYNPFKLWKECKELGV